jgi:hypothetical protein
MDEFGYISVPPKKVYQITVKVVYFGKGEPLPYQIEE